MSRVLNLILSHQPREELERLLGWWSSCAPAENLLVAYGGTEKEFEKLPDIQRIFVADPRLRVKDTPREKHSYGAVWRSAAEWLSRKEAESFTHVYFAECDHVPVVPDLATRLLARAEEERADVLVHGLHRVDGTSNVHYLYHLADPEFTNFWRRISVRADKDIVLKVVLTGSFWTRKAFLDVAAQPEDIVAFLEIYTPTVAHHLGFRVRHFREQDRCVATMPIAGLSPEKAREMGCWTMHPLKQLPVSYQPAEVREICKVP